MLISGSRFDFVWFRLSCDHGWIRSGSVNVRKTINDNVQPIQIRSCVPEFMQKKQLITSSGSVKWASSRYRKAAVKRHGNATDASLQF